MEKRTESWKREAPAMTYQPSGVSLTRTPIPISGRAMEAIKELKRQDMNSYLYLLMENMLVATVEGLCKEQGDMVEVVAGYLEGFYEREMGNRLQIPP